MKNISKIIFIISAVLLVLAITACDSLVAPQKGRNNPLDAQNPVPAPTDFNVWIVNPDPNHRNLNFTWNEGISEAEIVSLEGFIIIRKALEAPQSVYDGTPLVLKPVTETKEFIEDTIDVDGSGYPIGNKVYYSIFSYGPKWDEMNETEFLKLEDGVLKNAGNFNITGPVSTSVIVSASIILEVVEDGYVDDTSAWFMDQESFIATSSVPERNAFIMFDLAEIEGAEIADATLELTTYSPPDGDMGIFISLMKIDWRNGVWNDVSNMNAGAINSSYEITIYDADIPVTAPEFFEVDLKDITSAWSTMGLSNYGIRIRSSGAGGYSFQSNEHSGNKPLLHVDYYHE